MTGTIDPFGTESGGGFTTEYEGIVEDAFFGTDARYNEGKTMLCIWKMRTGEPVPEGVDPTKQPGPTLIVEERFSCGDGWQSFDGGETIEHPVGADKRFHENSLYGMIIKRCVQDFGIRDTLAARGVPTEAKMWKGLTFRMSQEDIEYGKEIGTKQRTLPAAYLGDGVEPRQIDVEGAEPAASGVGGIASQEAVGTPTVSQTPAPSAPAPNGIMATLPENVQAGLTVAATSSATHSDFIDKAMEVEGVITNPELVKALADESGLYTELKSS